jgi:hypothetical protein
VGLGLAPPLIPESDLVWCGLVLHTHMYRTYHILSAKFKKKNSYCIPLNVVGCPVLLKCRQLQIF